MPEAPTFLGVHVALNGLYGAVPATRQLARPDGMILAPCGGAPGVFAPRFPCGARVLPSTATQDRGAASGHAYARLPRPAAAHPAVNPERLNNSSAAGDFRRARRVGGRGGPGGGTYELCTYRPL